MNLNVIPFDRHQIYLLFYKPTEKDPFQNRLVAYVDGPFCHVEIAFPERFGQEPWEKTVWGSSIYQDETVFFVNKKYQRDGYVSCAIEVTTHQYHRIKNFCREQAERQTPFSKLAMYHSFLPFSLFHFNGTFCSKYVTMALQAGYLDIVANLNPNIISPSKLYHHVNTQNSILQAVPSKMSKDNVVPCSINFIRDIMMKQRLR